MAATVTKRVELLEKQQGLTLDLAARILEGKYDATTYGADSAEALLKAISGKYADLVAVPFGEAGQGPAETGKPILNTAGDDIRAMLEQAAVVVGIPLELMLAGVIAESGLNPKAERWGTETAAAKAWLAAGEYPPLQNIIDRTWPDISFGYSQRIVLYHWTGDHSATVMNCLKVRAAVFADPQRDLNEMAKKLGDCLHQARQIDASELRPVGGDLLLAALCIYNAGHFPDPVTEASWWQRWAGNVESYRQALTRAFAMV